MTPQQIQLVQDSFERVRPIAATAAGLFYQRLFELDPSLRPLFKGNMQEQGRMLMSMIGTAVRSLGDLPALVPALHSMGARHARYGVEDSHYDTVGSAFVWTLEQGLGDAFTPEVRGAWLQAYTTLASAMQAGAAIEAAAGNSLVSSV